MNYESALYDEMEKLRERLYRMRVPPSWPYVCAAAEGAALRAYERTRRKTPKPKPRGRKR